MIGWVAEEGKVDQAARDATGVALELIKGLSSQMVKELLFNRAQCKGHQAPGSAAADMEVETK